MKKTTPPKKKSTKKRPRGDTNVYFRFKHEDGTESQCTTRIKDPELQARWQREVPADGSRQEILLAAVEGFVTKAYKTVRFQDIARPADLKTAFEVALKLRKQTRIEVIGVIVEGYLDYQAEKKKLADYQARQEELQRKADDYIAKDQSGAGS